ncbi:uncharacterized protein F5147DRAFT_275206 [Suillus discolor]|uniref:Uncharacterized protein n=1 Tax=Suillus discolor TaxID=1912936 RepID=A0A9P7F2K2_9AGAM|nr:uncharacterized protein F5147DRAFT_275206 [Suillus discolor]KAG2103760.1 hypothetical protein F5147DRAFT_275206 [Suillus discolor]
MCPTLDVTDLPQHRMDRHWNSRAKTATATVELLKRQNINIKPHGKHLTMSVHLKRLENHKKGGCTVQQHFYDRGWDGYRALHRVKMWCYLHVTTCDCFVFVSLALCAGGIRILKRRCVCTMAMHVQASDYGCDFRSLPMNLLSMMKVRQWRSLLI